MTKTRFLLILPLLTACTPPVWVKDVPPEQQDRDRQECLYEAMKATAALESAWARATERSKLNAACLELRGYRKEKRA